MPGAGPNWAAKVDGNVAKDNVRIVAVYCSGAVTIGNPVAIDPADTTYGQGKSCKKNVVDDSPFVFGIAYETITAAGLVRVQVAGPIQATDAHNPKATGNITPAGKMISGNNTTTAGTIKAAANPTVSLWPFAVCMTPYTDTNADGSMFIIDKGWF